MDTETSKGKRRTLKDEHGRGNYFHYAIIRKRNETS